ncbi:MAG: hypothetical protein QNJ97_27520 [Myxococcota bacterium]|nr:hypothetical protein [Myxococcota bacterium]
MRRGQLKRPSLGFIAVVLTYGLVAVFFIWGFSTPDLDRIWQLHHLLKIGDVDCLKKEDRALVKNALQRHSRLALDLLDGVEIGILSAHMDGWIGTPCVTILRTAAAGSRTIEMDIQTPEDLMPFEIRLTGEDWKEQYEVTSHGTLRAPLPNIKDTAEVIDLKLKGAAFEADPSVLGIRIRFGEEK